MNSIIVGYGHCGKNLHHVCLRKLQPLMTLSGVCEQVHVVDPLVSLPASAYLVSHEQLPSPSSLRESVGVVHICTPPALHLQHVREALHAGYRYIILEKPMVISQAQATELSDLQRMFNAHILVVAVWAHSSLVKLMAQWVQASSSGITHLQVVHNKPRFSRTLQRHAEHIFDIEMPHQVSLALLFAGDALKLVDARSESLHLEGETRPSMKSGYLQLEGPQGERVRLTSDLSSPTRERRLSVEFDDGAFYQGYFPISADDSYSQFEAYDCSGARIACEVLADDPLTACLEAYYQYFLACERGESPLPPRGSSITFNQRIVELLEQARHLSETSDAPAAGSIDQTCEFGA
ncbi:Gfo/Idh/MocA family oxidoreductase [Pseudomonas sp. B329]|uniref:Gfo/Idh/MocA family protein n=1 Tax=Pseudomonas sp. B329 TaxID=1553459 RepID=UPI00249E6D2A|nr:Gfo/Idh/MocA family oxidoreductase [Pseudomonas sp. B329]